MNKAVSVEAFDVPDCFSSGCWGGLTAIDHRVFFGLCKHAATEHVRLCVYDHQTKKITELEQLQSLLENDNKAIAHGKIHTQFRVLNGIAYFATHVGYYKKDRQGLAPYPGGRLIGINLKTLVLTDFGILYPGEGIVSLDIDAKRKQAYAMTWPNGHLVKFDLTTHQTSTLGSYRIGDSGDTVCRSATIVDDCLLFCSADGIVHRLDLATGLFSQQPKELQRIALEQGIKENWQLPQAYEKNKDVEGFIKQSKAQAHWGQLWHPAIVDPTQPALLAVTNTSASLLRIWPRDNNIEHLGQFCLPELQGKFDIGTSTSLTLCAVGDKRLYHLGTKLLGDDQDPIIRMRLLSYDLNNHQQRDLGYLKTADGHDVIYLQTLAALPDGKLAGVGLIDLPKQEHPAFFAGKPAMVDVGIRAETNPYKMAFFVINPEDE